jgi:Berberine and berberine like
MFRNFPLTTVLISWGIIYSFFLISLPDSSFESTVTDFAVRNRRKLVETSGAPDLQVYVNYAHGDEGQSAWYAPRKLPKLRALKSKWDPDSLFRFTNALSPSYYRDIPKPFWA